MLPFDLHVLGMPPAFNLSQDQTLQFNLFASSKLTTLLLCTSVHFNSSKRPHSLSSLLLNELAPKACCVFYSSSTLCQTLFCFFLLYLLRRLASRQTETQFGLSSLEMTECHVIFIVCIMRIGVLPRQNPCGHIQFREEYIRLELMMDNREVYIMSHRQCLPK